MPDVEKVIKGLECCMLSYKDGCDECPYFGKNMYMCQELLGEDALALLKEQEPRVMTLEEVTEDRPDVVWFDDRHYKLTYPVFISNGEVTGWIVSQSRSCIERHDHVEGYGKRWRCWTSRPTDEQREAVKWK